MSERSEGYREGTAPTRHPIRWKEPGFYDEAALNAELAPSSARAVMAHKRILGIGPHVSLHFEDRPPPGIRSRRCCASSGSSSETRSRPSSGPTNP